jgi:4-hydroxy 2-oxovalerate aldolase
VTEAEPFEVNGKSERLGPVLDTAPLSLGLGVALALGATRISLVGFDGYESASLAKQALATETQNMVDDFRARFPDIGLATLTPSTYGVPAESLYGRLSRLQSSTRIR